MVKNRDIYSRFMQLNKNSQFWNFLTKHLHDCVRAPIMQLHLLDYTYHVPYLLMYT